VDHLYRTGDARWVLGGEDARPDIYYIAAEDREQVIGNITLKAQAIRMPAANGGIGQPVCGADGRPLCELFVQTFSVEDEYRRQGHGRALQTAALALAHKLNCHQVRSWSSADRVANHALKVEMGFAIHPGTFRTAAGQEISGVYFVKAVCADEALFEGTASFIESIA
jgi:GNAT superfamily N-acetyltransferase